METKSACRRLIANGSDFPLDTFCKPSHGLPAGADHDRLEAHHGTRLEVTQGLICSRSCDEESSDHTGMKTALKTNKDALRYTDRRLLGPLFVMAILHGFLKNVSHAKTMDLNATLHIPDNAWALLLTTFFLGFLISTFAFILCFKTENRPLLPTFLCLTTVLTGLVTIGNGVVPMALGDKTWYWIAFSRFLQGLSEGAFTTLLVTYLLQFYTTDQLCFRMFLFFLVPGAASAIGALYAFGCYHIPSKILLNWQWFFIGEGVFAIVTGCLAYLILPRQPSLSQSTSRPVAITDTKSPGVVAVEQWMSLKDCFSLLASPAGYSWMLIDLALGFPVSMVLLYLPQIIIRIGVPNQTANLLTVFPYLTAVACLFIMMRFSETRSKEAAMTVIFGLQAFGFTLYRLSFVLQHQCAPLLAYIATFFMATGLGTTNVLAARLYGPHIKRKDHRLFLNAVGVGLINSAGIATTWLFRSKHMRAEEVTIGFCVLGMLTARFGMRGPCKGPRVQQETPDC